MTRFPSPWHAVSLTALVISFGGTSFAQHANIIVTDAKIAGGKLVITGKTPGARQHVRLDGQTAAPFNVTSNANKLFTFRLVYLPDDCIVALQKLTPPSTPAINAVVADCGPGGVDPRGNWSAGVSYFTNDLVLFQGSTWRAKRNNLNKQPQGGPDWQVFASKGADGSDGARGERGIQGEQGPQGIQGEQGPPGPSTGPAGGDLAGTYPNPTINTGAVNSAKILDDSVTGADINESTLALGSFFVAASATGSNCTGGDGTFVNCAVSTITLPRPGKLLVNATGEWVTSSLDDFIPPGVQDDPTLVTGRCRLTVDGAPIGLSQSMGELGLCGDASCFSFSPNHPIIFDDGPGDPLRLAGTMALTALSAVLPAANHQIAVACNEEDGDIDWTAINLTAVLVDD